MVSCSVMESGLIPGVLVDGKYKIVRLIGSGGMGSVYEGENVRIGRKVAIKVLHASIALERRLVERFEREAQAVARIGSHHVADVLDVGELATGDRYMVMEYLRGETLAERLKTTGALAPATVIAIIAQLLDGLAMMHDAGIIHRDLKPGNIFLATTSSGDFVKILDFGICKFRAATDMQWTTVGSTVLGTPGYLSPEQLTTEDVGADADLYAAGVLLYRCIAGRLPYDAESKAELLLQIRDGLRVPIEQTAPELDKNLAAMVMKSISPDPAERFPSARDFKDALLAWAKGAEQREKLFAEFLDRPQTVHLVPGQASHPLRVTAEPSASAPPDTKASDAPPRPRQEPVREDAVSTTPVDMTQHAPHDPPVYAHVSTKPAPVAPDPTPEPSATLAIAHRPPSRLTAVLVGAAVGAVGAVILYEAFRR
jgi:eukaryotic-like serine/threonine-protein kinase